MGVGQQLKRSEVRPLSRSGNRGDSRSPRLDHGGRNRSKDQRDRRKTDCRGRAKGDAGAGQATVRGTERQRWGKVRP